MILQVCTPVVQMKRCFISCKHSKRPLDYLKQRFCPNFAPPWSKKTESAQGGYDIIRTRCTLLFFALEKFALRAKTLRRQRPYDRSWTCAKISLHLPSWVLYRPERRVGFQIKCKKLDVEKVWNRLYNLQYNLLTLKKE